MKKINIGAGTDWYHDGWDVLDNGSGSYDEPWKIKGKSWDSNLPDNSYDIIFTSHMLEHIPHFRIEKTIAEFNRVLKKGGKLRILVPSLKKYATAYVNGDKSYFSGSKHYSSHLGIGGSFVRLIISPGQQTIAFSREMDEIFGGYAHLYAYDFDMMRIMLEKWGFGEIVESEPGMSSISELRDFQHLIHDGQRFERSDEFVRKREYLKTGKKWYFSGFDKQSQTQLVIEATKVRDEPYSYDKEYEYNKIARFDDKLSIIKISVYRKISHFIDFLDSAARKTGLINLIRLIMRLKR